MRHCLLHLDTPLPLASLPGFGLSSLAFSPSPSHPRPLCERDDTDLALGSSLALVLNLLSLLGIQFNAKYSRISGVKSRETELSEVSEVR